MFVHTYVNICVDEPDVAADHGAERVAEGALGACVDLE